METPGSLQNTGPEVFVFNVNRSLNLHFNDKGWHIEKAGMPGGQANCSARW
jgi:hypothetical protein